MLDLAWMHRNFLPLLTGSVLFSFSLSLYLYLASFAKGALLATGGDTSVGFYNFFIGRELNPRIGYGLVSFGPFGISKELCL